MSFVSRQRKQRRSSLSFITMAFLLLTPLATALAEVKPFTFVHISDTHIGGKGYDEKLKDALRDIDKNFPEAAFIINTGDVTEYGYVDEFKRYAEVVRNSKRKIYVCPGNHDVRWSESGKENYRRLCGKDYTSFDHNGVHFVLMDETMLLQHYGHFDKRLMDRLKGELEALSPGQPAIIGVHHPPLSDGHYIDNEYDFAELIRPYNVPLVCDGHGHSFQTYEFNGTTYAMGGSTATGNTYRVYRVTPEKIELVQRNFEKDTTRVNAEIPVQRAKERFGSLLEVSPDASGTTTPALSFRIEGTDGAGAITAEWTLDKVPQGAVEVDSDGIMRLADKNALGPGWHQLVVEVAADRRSTCVRSLMLPVNVATAGTGTAALDKSRPAIVREFPLGSASQAHPAVNGDTLYVAANDGQVRAIDLPTGETKWETDLNREVVSSPAIAGDRLVVGSLDRNVYCLNPKTGDVRWKHRTGQSVMATAAIRDNTVYIGSGDYNLYALNLRNGREKWSFHAKRYIKMTPAFAGDRLFFGAWDNTIYSLNAADGELLWKVPASVSPHFSAATSNPVTTDTKLIQVTHDYSIRCLDQNTGSHIWLYKPRTDKDWSKAELGPSYCSPVVIGDKVYFGSINGHVVAHDVETGAKVLDVELRKGRRDPVFDSSPRIIGDKLYICSVEGNLYCVDIPKASVAWSVALQPGFLFTTPVDWKGHLLVTSMGDKVFEIAPPGGE